MDDIENESPNIDETLLDNSGSNYKIDEDNALRIVENDQNDPQVNNDIYESEEEENYYENPLELIREFGNNPLMDRAQKVLLDQLKETNYKITTEIYEKKEELKRIAQNREEVGIQLYSLQQQLARIQISLENAHSEYNGLLDARLQEEEMLNEITKNNKEQTALYEEYNKQYKKNFAELESLNETLRQIEKYNDEVKSEIALTRRAAYKTEQNIQDLEKEKEDQDFLVDSYTKKINNLISEIEHLGKQYEVQQQDTNDAIGVLQDTMRELELIGNEKKQLMVQWKAALSGLSRRDEALAQARQTLETAERAVHDYDVQIEASRRELQKEQARHESLVNLRDRLDNELNWVEDNLSKIRAEREQLNERYALLQKSLAQTDSELKKMATISKGLESDLESAVQTMQSLINDRHLLEEDLQVIHSTKQNVSKAVENLQKQEGKVLKSIHDQEIEANNTENEISRVSVEKINVSAVIDQLKDQLSQAEKEVSEKESLASKYQLEIRQRNDEVEKKMYRVDRLNKKFEKMVESAGGEENLGPLENTIKNLNKEIDSVNQENKFQEHEWLRRQTELVNFTAECDGLAEKNNEEQARVTLLTQQQIRLNKDLRELKANLKVGRQLNIDYQKDISKLNSLISTNHEQENELQASNYIIEMDCVDELKTAESECFEIQNNIAEVKQAKASLLDEIMEMERQALLWEKKIQLDKETREALDPSVGVKETEDMEKEIHRMAVRFEALKREQERLASEMERAILKRNSIANRYGNASTERPSKKAQPSKKELTIASAKKRIGELKKESRVLAEQITKVSSNFDEKKKQLDEVSAALESITLEYSENEEECHQIQSDINDLLYQKQLHQERISYRQKFSNRLKDLYQNSTFDSSHVLQVERRLVSATQSLDNVKEIIEEIGTSFPHLKEVLQRVEAMTDPVL